MHAKLVRAGPIKCETAQRMFPVAILKLGNLYAPLSRWHNRVPPGNGTKKIIKAQPEPYNWNVHEHS